MSSEVLVWSKASTLACSSFYEGRTWSSHHLFRNSNSNSQGKKQFVHYVVKYKHSHIVRKAGFVKAEECSVLIAMESWCEETIWSKYMSSFYSSWKMLEHTHVLHGPYATHCSSLHSQSHKQYMWAAFEVELLSFICYLFDVLFYWCMKSWTRKWCFWTKGAANPQQTELQNCAVCPYRFPSLPVLRQPIWLFITEWLMRVL